MVNNEPLPNDAVILSETTGRPKRIKIDTACDVCRRRKVKCDGIRPACGNCHKKIELRYKCHYSESSGGEPIYASVSGAAASSSSQTPATSGRSAQRLLSERPGTQTAEVWRKEPPTLGASDGSETPSVPQLEHASPRDNLHDYGGSSLRAFTDRLKAAVDKKLGLPAGEKPILVPTTDAPLFLSPACNLASDLPSHDNVLPSRKLADQLVATYWAHLHPINPTLDEKQFGLSYKALFAGTLTDGEERLFLSTLNVVLAMSTQYQEHIPLDQRQQDSVAYFCRAWSLLRLGEAIWEVPSLELVECLLLMATYLQCTNKPHQTWVAVGSAVRIAQGLGLHVPESLAGADWQEKARRKRIWYSCAFLDKQVSMSLGRPAAIQRNCVEASLNLPDTEAREDRSISEDEFFTKTLELYTWLPTAYEPHPRRSVTNYANIAQDEDKDYMQEVLNVDRHVERWKQSISARLQNSSGATLGDSHTYQRVAVCFRLRSAHARIILFRPMLAHFSLFHPSISSNITVDQTLRQRLIHNCACICIENAQDVIGTLEEYCGQPGAQGGLVPWWIRLYYLHVAGTVLIAATMRPDISSQLAVGESWDRLISLLHRHEHLSSWIPQYLEVLETLSFEVLQAQFQDAGGWPAVNLPNSSMGQDAFREDAYPADFPFGLEDIFYLNPF